MPNYSPILVSVYNRLDHLQQCVRSLQRNALSQHSDLYIVSDAAFAEQDEPKVAQVREYIDRIEGFNRVVAIRRKGNLGSYASIKMAIDDVSAQHGTVIFLEDDNIVAPHFLQFVNDALNFYRDDPTIFSVSGYQYPVQIAASYPYDVYKWQGFSAWGVGVWADRWHAVDWHYPELSDLAPGKPVRRGLDQIAEHLCQQMIYDIRRRRKIIDVTISYYLYRHQLYSIFPVISRVRNIGHDGTGEHGGITDLYSRQALDESPDYQFVKNIQPDAKINQVLWQHFRIPRKSKVIIALANTVSPNQKKWIKTHLLHRSR